MMAVGPPHVQSTPEPAIHMRITYWVENKGASEGAEVAMVDVF